MPALLLMPPMTSQFLQVPKTLPVRKPSRSRSKSRPRESVPIPDTSPAPSTIRRRPQTPPIPAVNLEAKPTLDAFTGIQRATNGKLDAEDNPGNGVAISPQAAHSMQEVQQTGTNYDDLNEDMYAFEPCRTPPPPEPLRSKLIGAWKLESYITYPTPTSTVQRPTHPMTKNVTGFIMYTPDGYMSAQMLIPGQQSFKRGEGEEAQWAEAGKRFFAYCGPYYISNEGPGREEVLRHTFQVCNLPGWIGDIQIRTHHFEDDGQVLVLGSEEPAEIKGDKRIPVLKWRRARNNVDGVPPPPTPQIKISGPGEP